jgi:hypothetical protein
MMRWFRSRARLGSRLALFALALQLVVSFGHVHADQLAPSAVTAASHAAAVPSNDVPAAPAHHDGQADGLCAICALIHMAGTAAPGVAPALPVPIGFFRTPIEFAVTPALTASLLTSFQARAPPIA